MFTKKITMTLVATSLAMTIPATKVSADAGDAIVGGIIGGIVGGAIANNNKKKKVYKKSGVSSATRAQNREIQTSLNYFGFPAGTPDGVLGRNSRSAISQYQAFMGYPATGQLTQYEREFLINSYHRAVAGGPATTQLIAQNPQGARGLLKTYQQQAAGVPGTTMVVAPQVQPVPGTTVVVNPQVVPTPQTTTTTVATTPIAPAAPASPALPNFMGKAEMASLTSHCNQVSLVTNSNGGFTTEALMTDANFALDEQFCLARTYAIARGEEMMGQVQGFTQAQFNQQCAGFGPAMKDHVSALSFKPQTEVLQGVGQFVLGSGMSPEQLTGTAKICLSVGYRTDDMNVALGSALLLTALGQTPYAELMGHHLTQGFGTSKRPDLALPWYEAATNAIKNGVPAVFAPGQPERNGLIIKAAYQLNGRASATTPAPMAAPQPAALPSFSIQN